MQLQESNLDFVVTHLRTVLSRKYKKLAKLEEALNQKNNYEQAFCEFFELKPITEKETLETRYGDAYLYDPERKRRGIKLELKKTKAGAYWLDAVRYSEMIAAKARPGLIEQKKAALAVEDSITIFIKLKSSGLGKIFCLDTSELIRFLDLDMEDVVGQLRFFQRHCDSVNSQLSVRMSNLEVATRGYLITFEKHEIKTDPTLGTKTHRDFPKKKKQDQIEDEAKLILNLIAAHGKETFSAHELWAARQGISTRGVAYIRSLLRKMAQETEEYQTAIDGGEDPIELTKPDLMLMVNRGRYWRV